MLSLAKAIKYFWFFFSSRRRHTRWPRDWSSDVCSSDLELSVLQYQVLDGGSAVQMSTESFASTDDVRCVLTELEAPSATWVKIGNTRALDGRQEDDWPGFKASWTYHPDSGLNILIERDR